MLALNWQGCCVLFAARQSLTDAKKAGGSLEDTFVHVARRSPFLGQAERGVPAALRMTSESCRCFKSMGKISLEQRPRCLVLEPQSKE